MKPSDYTEVGGPFTTRFKARQVCWMLGGKKLKRSAELTAYRPKGSVQTGAFLLYAPGKCSGERMKIFWSWQSDHEADISHYFVRDALKDAIKVLKQAEDLEEPDEAARRANIHWDSDTQNLTGMPDIAPIIFEKIDASAVFIADVTPVGSSPSKKDKNGDEVGLRPIMNPNVAIELGYALRGLGWSKCLAVINTAYGSVEESMPFDLKQKRHPIRYHLAQGADKVAIKAEQAKLAKTFVDVLRPFLKAVPVAAPAKFQETPAVRPPAFWFAKDEIVGARHDQQLTMPFERVLYLRIIPTKELDMLIPHDKLRQVVSAYLSFVLEGNINRVVTEHGAATYEPYGPEPNHILSIAHHFHNGEIWAINADIIHYGTTGTAKLLMLDQIEALYRNRLPHFLECVTTQYGVTFPIHVVAGLVKVKGLDLAYSGGPGRGVGTMIKDNVELDRILNVGDKRTVDQFLFNFFEKIWEGAGKERPIHFLNFPPQ